MARSVDAAPLSVLPAMTAAQTATLQGHLANHRQNRSRLPSVKQRRLLAQATGLSIQHVATWFRLQRRDQRTRDSAGRPRVLSQAPIMSAAPSPPPAALSLAVPPTSAFSDYGSSTCSSACSDADPFEYDNDPPHQDPHDDPQHDAPQKHGGPQQQHPPFPPSPPPPPPDNFNLFAAAIEMHSLTHSFVLPSFPPRRLVERRPARFGLSTEAVTSPDGAAQDPQLAQDPLTASFAPAVAPPSSPVSAASAASPPIESTLAQRRLRSADALSAHSQQPSPAGRTYPVLRRINTDDANNDRPAPASATSPPWPDTAATIRPAPPPLPPPPPPPSLPWPSTATATTTAKRQSEPQPQPQPQPQQRPRPLSDSQFMTAPPTPPSPPGQSSSGTSPGGSSIGAPPSEISPPATPLRRRSAQLAPSAGLAHFSGDGYDDVVAATAASASSEEEGMFVWDRGRDSLSAYYYRCTPALPSSATIAGGFF